MVMGLMSAFVFISCEKEDESFKLIGTTWIGESLYDLQANQWYNGDIEYILNLTGEGSGTLMTVDNHTSRAEISVTTGESVTWSLNGNTLNLQTSTESLSGDLSYSNRNVNFMRTDEGVYLAFDLIDSSRGLATKVFRGTFTKAGTSEPLDCVWIFLSGKGWKMMVPDYPVTLYPLSPYEIDNAGNLVVHFFAGNRSYSESLDLTSHSGTYTSSNDSIVYNTSNVSESATWPVNYDWRGVFRLKEVK